MENVRYRWYKYLYEFDKWQCLIMNFLEEGTLLSAEKLLHF